MNLSHGVHQKMIVDFAWAFKFVEVCLWLLLTALTYHLQQSASVEFKLRLGLLGPTKNGLLEELFHKLRAHMFYKFPLGSPAKVDQDHNGVSTSTQDKIICLQLVKGNHSHEMVTTPSPKSLKRISFTKKPLRNYKSAAMATHSGQVAHQAAVYPGFCTPSWMGCQFIAGLPSALISPVPIYTPGWREARWE